MKRNLILTLIALLIAIGAGCVSFVFRRTVNITFTGDILLDRGVRNVIEEKGTEYPYKEIKNIFNNDDITFGNLECPITDKGTPVLKRPYLIFRGAPDNVKSLKNAGYDILNLANNHIMDYGHEGIKDTMDRLSIGGIAYIGAGDKREDAYKPVFIQKNGIKIGFLSYSDFPPEGYVYSKTQSDIARTDENMMHNSIVNARKQCDFLIVSFHWGTEYSFYPSDMQKKYSHDAIDWGADFIVGHHPHVLQSIEKYKDKYIFYSLGNFVFDRQIYPKTDDSIVLLTNIDRKGIKKIKVIPVKIVDCQPKIAKGDDEAAIIKNLVEYSKNKRADLKVDNNKLIINR